jgi:hypothetical protein
MTAPLAARGQASHCMKCGKSFGRGDRITLAYIVVKTLKDPKNPMQMAAELLSSEFEFIHVDCNDPGLENGKGAAVILNSSILPRT